MRNDDDNDDSEADKCDFFRCPFIELEQQNRKNNNKYLMKIQHRILSVRHLWCAIMLMNSRVAMS